MKPISKILCFLLVLLAVGACAPDGSGGGSADSSSTASQQSAWKIVSTWVGWYPNVGAEAVISLQNTSETTMSYECSFILIGPTNNVVASNDEGENWESLPAGLSGKITIGMDVEMGDVSAGLKYRIYCGTYDEMSRGRKLVASGDMPAPAL